MLDTSSLEAEARQIRLCSSPNTFQYFENFPSSTHPISYSSLVPAQCRFHSYSTALTIANEYLNQTRIPTRHNGKESEIGRAENQNQTQKLFFLSGI